jgi:hypothetical protein
MTDIIERLRKWCHAPDAVSAQDIMEEAANRLEASRQQVRFWKDMYEQHSAEPRWMERSQVEPSDPTRQCLLYTDKLEGFMWIGRKGLLPSDVSHWMFLPEPPNAGKSSPHGGATKTPSSDP